MPNTPIPQQSPLDRGAGRIARNRMRIAWMYYVEGMTQNEIAERLGIGRVTVVRNINEAIKQREVKIRIEGDIAECIEIEDALKKKFNLQEAIVVPEPTNPENIAKSIGNAAGMFISDILKDGMCVMADRGFKFIDRHLADKNCVLIRPPSVGQDEILSPGVCRESKEIAALRGHVERVIRRIREFKLVTPHSCVDIKTVRLLDCSVFVAAGLCNLQGEMIK